MEARRFELGAGGALVPIDPKAGSGLPLDTVLHWGGNMAWAECDYCIVGIVPNTGFGGSYECFDIEHPEKNAMLYRVEWSSIKHEDDPKVWHSQHFFVTNVIHTPDQVAVYLTQHKAQREAFDAAKAAASAETDRLTEIGKRLWRELGFEGAEHIIVAEHEVDDSDVQTDYFSSHTSDTVLLARSEHGRDLFSELRKAALLIPETECYGTGRGLFHPCVRLDTDIPAENGPAYWKGLRSHWHHELDAPEGNLLTFTRREEAEAYIQKAGPPRPIMFNDCKVKAEFSWQIVEDEIEHREKYSGGHGYYLGADRHSGWQVRKVSVGKDGSYFVDLAERHEHLIKKGKPAPAPVATDGKATVTENTEKGGIEIRFPSKPEQAVIDSLKANGWRWSKFAACWYKKRSEEAQAFAQKVTA